MSSNSKPLISVIMATYNGEDYISEAIESILCQTFEDFELIIVNDGSTDKTEVIIKSYKDPRIRYICKDLNSGIADSLNMGIEIAKGKYIARMDDDDISLPERFEVQINFLELNRSIGVCASNIKTEKLSPEPTEKKHEDIKMAMLFMNPIVHPTVMFRTEVLKNHKYNSKMVPSEDYDLWSRLIQYEKFHKIKDELLFYRDDGESETTRRRKEQLDLNRHISKRLFLESGFQPLIEDDTYLNIIASHDYSIEKSELKGLLKWTRDLIHHNQIKKIFSIEQFTIVVNSRVKNYIKAYFQNRSIKSKMIAFFVINKRLKIEMIKVYLNKFIRE